MGSKQLEVHEKIIRFIRSGKLDNHLSTIAAEFNARQRAITHAQARDVAGRVKVGSRVKLKGTRPQYLNGMTGTIVALISNTKVSVRLDRGAVGKFASGKVVTPYTCLEPVDGG